MIFHTHIADMLKWLCYWKWVSYLISSPTSFLIQFQTSISLLLQLLFPWMFLFPSPPKDPICDSQQDLHSTRNLRSPGPVLSRLKGINSTFGWLCIENPPEPGVFVCLWVGMGLCECIWVHVYAQCVVYVAVRSAWCRWMHSEGQRVGVHKWRWWSSVSNPPLSPHLPFVFLSLPCSVCDGHSVNRSHCPCAMSWLPVPSPSTHHAFQRHPWGWCSVENKRQGG